MCYLNNKGMLLMNEIIKRILNDKGYDDKSNFFLESLKKSDKKNLDICFLEAKKANVNLFDYGPIYGERNLPIDIIIKNFSKNKNKEWIPYLIENGFNPLIKDLNHIEYGEISFPYVTLMKILYNRELQSIFINNDIREKIFELPSFEFFTAYNSFYTKRRNGNTENYSSINIKNDSFDILKEFIKKNNSTDCFYLGPIFLKKLHEENIPIENFIIENLQSDKMIREISGFYLYNHKIDKSFDMLEKFHVNNPSLTKKIISNYSNQLLFEINEKFEVLNIIKDDERKIDYIMYYLNKGDISNINYLIEEDYINIEKLKEKISESFLYNVCDINNNINTKMISYTKNNKDLKIFLDNICILSEKFDFKILESRIKDNNTEMFFKIIENLRKKECTWINIKKIIINLQLDKDIFLENIYMNILKTNFDTCHFVLNNFLNKFLTKHNHCFFFKKMDYYPHKENGKNKENKDKEWLDKIILLLEKLSEHASFNIYNLKNITIEDKISIVKKIQLDNPMEQLNDFLNIKTLKNKENKEKIIEVIMRYNALGLIRENSKLINDLCEKLLNTKVKKEIESHLEWFEISKSIEESYESPSLIKNKRI